MRISGMLAQVSIFAGLLIQVQCQSSSAVTTIPPVSRERLNFTKLAVTCREQSGKKQCPKGEQFCTETNDCPEEHICTCTKWCQHLLCVIPAARDVCRWHPVPRNGYIIQKSTFLEFRCNHGYVVEEPRNKTCENGEWKPNDRHPTCKAVQCGSHPLLENGLMMFDPADCPEEFKTRVYFFCNPGYTLVGASHRVCTASQRWSGDMPSCRRDGQWGNWSEWSNCEITCGSGRQVRFRRCNAPQEGGKECEGLAMETRICFAARACRVPTPSTSLQSKVIAVTDRQTTAVTVARVRNANAPSTFPATSEPQSTTGLSSTAHTSLTTPATSSMVALPTFRSTEQQTLPFLTPTAFLPSHRRKCNRQARNCAKNGIRACKELTKCMRERNLKRWTRTHPVCGGSLIFKNLCKFFEWVCLGEGYAVKCLVKQPMSCCQRTPAYRQQVRLTPIVFNSPPTTSSAIIEPRGNIQPCPTQTPRRIRFHRKKPRRKTSTKARGPPQQPIKKPKKVKLRRRQVPKKLKKIPCQQQTKILKRQLQRPSRILRPRRYRHGPYRQSSIHLQGSGSSDGDHDGADYDGHENTYSDSSSSDLRGMSTTGEGLDVDDTATLDDSSGTLSGSLLDGDLADGDAYGRAEPLESSLDDDDEEEEEEQEEEEEEEEEEDA